MLKKIHLHNFKSVKSLDLSLSPLTVLTGLNGSGKSSVLQALALLRQSLMSRPAGDRLILRGSLVQLGRSEDVHFEGAIDGSLEIGVTSSEGAVDLVAHYIGVHVDTLQTALEGDGIEVLQELMGDFQFIQADRLTPATQYPQASTPDQESGWLGCQGEYTVDYLQRNADKKVSPERFFPRNRGSIPKALFAQVAPTDSLLDQTAGWLQQLSPGVRPRAVSVELADAASLRFEYTGTGVASGSRQHRPGNVGFGLTYILPILVACLSASKGSLLLLENPEAHLHPRGQSALGLLLAMCAADGTQIIVETHSDHLLNGIRLAAKQKCITAGSVAVHFFTRNVESGESTVSSPTLLENGRFDEWPEGFFDEWTKALDDLLED